MDLASNLPEKTGASDGGLLPSEPQAAGVLPRPATTTIAQAIRDGAARLRNVANNPRLESRLLLAHALGVTQNDLIRSPELRVDTVAFDALLTRRQAHEPIALIVGRQEFWSLAFAVSPATLVPRADSETLIRAAHAHFTDRVAPTRILDLGTGTGCLLLALLEEFPGAFGIGTDIVPAAANLARSNAAQLGQSRRCAFVCGDWDAPLSGRFDLIVCNPPYIAAGDIPGLMPEVSRHEPRSALDGGIDGYDAYRCLLPRLPALLAPEGIAVLELGDGQTPAVSAMAGKAGFRSSLHLDLAGIERAILLDRRPA